MTGSAQPQCHRLTKEEADLARAEQDIAEGQMRITGQELRIEKLRIEGRDTSRSEDLLETLRATLAEWYAHRETILETIRRLRNP